MGTHNESNVRHSTAVKDLHSKIDHSKQGQKLVQSKTDALEKGKGIRFAIESPPHVGHLHHLQSMAESIDDSTASQVKGQARNGRVNPNDAISDRIEDSLKSLD